MKIPTMNNPIMNSPKMKSYLPCTLVLVLMLFTTSATANNTQFTDINGNRIAWQCKGKDEAEGKVKEEGTLTALLIAGMGLDAQGTYKNTFRRANPKGYRLCQYDRAGTGKSTFPNRRVRTMAELEAELTQFTHKNQMNQLVLVAHSFGGFIARAFTAKNPDKVRAIIFLDAAHESWYQDMQQSMSEPAWQTMRDIIEWEKHKHSFEDFEEAVSNPEIYQLKKALPIVVMSRGIPHLTIRQTGMSYKDVDAYDDSWNRSQQKLRELAPNTKYITMKYASHLFDDTDPWIVIEEIDKTAQQILKANLKTKR